VSPQPSDLSLASESDVLCGRVHLYRAGRRSDAHPDVDFDTLTFFYVMVSTSKPTVGPVRAERWSLRLAARPVSRPSCKHAEPQAHCADSQLSSRQIGIDTHRQDPS
jgi:hypothetical protein